MLATYFGFKSHSGAFILASHCGFIYISQCLMKLNTFSHALGYLNIFSCKANFRITVCCKMRLSKGWGCNSVVESLASMLLALDSISNIGIKIELLGFHTYFLELLDFCGYKSFIAYFISITFCKFECIQTFKEHRFFCLLHCDLNLCTNLFFPPFSQRVSTWCVLYKTSLVSCFFSFGKVILRQHCTKSKLTSNSPSG